MARRLQHGFSLFEDETHNFDRRIADYYRQCWADGILVAALEVILPLLVVATQLGFHTSHMDLICAREHYKHLDQVNEREFGNLPERIIIVTFRAVQATLVALIPLAMGSLWTLGFMGLFQIKFNVANLLGSGQRPARLIDGLAMPGGTPCRESAGTRGSLATRVPCALDWHGPEMERRSLVPHTWWLHSTDRALARGEADEERLLEQT